MPVALLQFRTRNYSLSVKHNCVATPCFFIGSLSAKHTVILVLTGLVFEREILP